MPKIRISEKEQLETGDFTVTVAFEGDDEFPPLTVHDPFTPQNNACLEWHFEQFVSYPYLNDVKPLEAETIIRTAGENLFAQLFSGAEIYRCYNRIAQDGLGELVFEICGSPEFHSLHWESLKDPRFPKPLAIESLILRKDLKPQDFAGDPHEASTVNLLVVAARPRGRHDVGYRTISRPLVELLRSSNLPVRMHILRPATFESLSRHLDTVRRGFYHVVHFDMHGALLTYQDFESFEAERTGTKVIEKKKAEIPVTYQTESFERYGRPNKLEPFTGKDAFLFFDYYREPAAPGDDGFRADSVRADELVNLLLTYGVPLVILNACQSAKELGEQENAGALPIAGETSLASRLMRAGAQMVLAMAYSVTVTAAEILMKSLYQEIFRGKSLHKAIQTGRRELFNRKLRRAAFNYQITLEDWLLPVVYQKRSIELKTKKLSGQESEDLLQWQKEINRMPEVEYGFYGRDIDILNIERRVLLKNNILLMRGMGGAGKTTLLNHLAWWWRATGLIEKVFYFGYDAKAYTRQQIMLEIAQTFYEKFELAEFQVMGEKAQMQKLCQKLRTERHLLILDNLESIQGGYFAIKNTLTAEEQTKLKEFLAELRGTDDAFQPQTIVLLGSRSAEEWLGDKTYRKNLYDLGGLDPESATQFAEDILKENELTHYRKEEDFKKLLKLLAGFPLPLKVVLENLKRQTPTQILDALRAGDVNLTTGTAEERTADILKCIDYSHSNIAPEKQELLLCLAPFTSVVNRAYFELYIEELKKHEALAHLNHELWDEVFTESIERGLMSKQEEFPLVNLQPILPYFLKTEWQKAERADFKNAVKMAFQIYYNQVSASILNLIKSHDANEKILGQFLIDLEFENIDTCLEFSLKTETSIGIPFFLLSVYYDSMQNHQAGLDLGTKVLNKIENYLSKITDKNLEFEFVYILYDIANRQLNLKEYEKAVISYEKSLEFLKNSKYIENDIKRKFSAPIYKDLGVVAFDSRQWQKAEEYYLKALQIYIEFDVYIEQADIYYNLGLTFSGKNDLDKSEEYYLKALKIYGELNDIPRQAPLFQSLGVLRYKKGDLDGAESYYEAALQIFTVFNESYLRARVLNDLGALAQEQNDWQKAQKYLQQAIEIYIEINEYYSQAPSFNNLGVIAHRQDKWTEAERYYTQALNIYIHYKEHYESAVIILNLGLLAKKQFKRREAENYFEEALKIFIELNERPDIGKTLSYLGELWEEINDEELLSRVGEILAMSPDNVRKIFESREDKSTSKQGNDE